MSLAGGPFTQYAYTNVQVQMSHTNDGETQITISCCGLYERV